MDPGGIGALIGVMILVVSGLCTKVYDTWKQSREATLGTPLMAPRPSSSGGVRHHSKINMILPK